MHVGLLCNVTMSRAAFHGVADAPTNGHSQSTVPSCQPELPFGLLVVVGAFKRHDFNQRVVVSLRSVVSQNPCICGYRYVFYGWVHTDSALSLTSYYSVPNTGDSTNDHNMTTWSVAQPKRTLHGDGRANAKGSCRVVVKRHTSGGSVPVHKHNVKSVVDSGRGEVAFFEFFGEVNISRKTR